MLALLFVVFLLWLSVSFCVTCSLLVYYFWLLSSCRFCSLVFLLCVFMFSVLPFLCCCLFVGCVVCCFCLFNMRVFVCLFLLSYLLS